MQLWSWSPRAPWLSSEVVVGGAVVVVEVVVVGGVVVVVVAGTACHWAYRVKSAVWLCPCGVIWVPPDAAVYQPVKM